MSVLLSQVTVGQLQSVLLWAAVLNYAVLLLAVVAWAAAGDALCRLHSRMFALERSQCHAAVYLMLGIYKLGIWLLFLTPWIGLCIVYGIGGTP